MSKKGIPKKKIWDSIESEGDHVYAIYDTQSESLKPKAEFLTSLVQEILETSVEKVNLAAQKVGLDVKLKAFIIISQTPKG